MSFDPPDYDVPICPVCGKECEMIYKDAKLGDIIGCDECIDAVSADECDECFPEYEWHLPN